MSLIEKKYDETLASIVGYYEDKIVTDPAGTLALVTQELESENVRYGNNWTGRGVVMDTVIAATISALEIVRSTCENNLKNNFIYKETDKMNMETYFSKMKGIGVMATSDKNGVVDTAIYSRPHVQGRDELAFIMHDRLTHKNLQENNHAGYLFLEEGKGYSGVRLFLSKIDESSDPELISSLTRRHLSPEDDRLQGEKFLVRFRVDRALSLIGGNEVVIE